jgi:hypothetical protein
MARFARRAGTLTFRKKADRPETVPKLCAVGQAETRQSAADKAYDTNAIPQHLESAGIKAVIPSRANRRVPTSYDKLSERFL